MTSRSPRSTRRSDPGRFDRHTLREFAFTLAGAVVVSGIVALTLSPMMCSKMLRSGDSHKGFAGFVNRRFDGLRNRYVRTLGNTLRWRPVTLHTRRPRHSDGCRSHVHPKELAPKRIKA